MLVSVSVMFNICFFLAYFLMNFFFYLFFISLKAKSIIDHYDAKHKTITPPTIDNNNEHCPFSLPKKPMQGWILIIAIQEHKMHQKVDEK